ncbi:MAG: hypothetical protein LBP98_10245 [Tannerella sp.]|jgi:hypothetical protein|nr:hypothetical protein [Tannerella sp.]
MKKYLFLMPALALALGGGLTGCNPSADVEPEPEVVIPDEPEVPECNDPLCHYVYHYDSNGADFWPSLRTDTAIRNRLIGKWQQIAWSSSEQEEIRYEDSGNRIEFTAKGEWIRVTSRTDTWIYRIDSIYLYSTKVDEGKPVINGNVFFYAYQFSGSGNELTIKLLWGNTTMELPGVPFLFMYKRIE